MLAEKWSAMTERATSSRIFEQYGPAILMSIGSCCFATMDACAKALVDTRNVPAPSVLLIRMSVTAVIAAIYMHKTGITDPVLGPQGSRLWMLLRGFLGAIGVLGMYSAVHWLPLNETLSIWFLSPILTGIFAALFLSEPYTRAEIIAGLTSLVGVLLVTKPIANFSSSDTGSNEQVRPHHRLLGLGEAAISTIFGSLCFIILRKLGDRVHALHSVYFFGVVTTCLMLPILAIYPEQRLDPAALSASDYLMLSLLSMFGWLATYLTNYAVQLGKAAYTSSFLYIQLPLIMWYSYIFFDDVMDLLGVLGCCMIVASAVATTLTKESRKPVASSAESRKGDYIALEEGPESSIDRGLRHSESP